MKNIYHLIAGLIYLFTALLHTIGGQISLINPMLQSNLDNQTKTELLGAWHMVTIILWIFGYFLFRNGLKFKIENKLFYTVLGYLTFAFGTTFILASIFQKIHAPQYILFIPIAILIIVGNTKYKNQLT